MTNPIFSGEPKIPIPPPPPPEIFCPVCGLPIDEYGCTISVTRLEPVGYTVACYKPPVL